MANSPLGKYAPFVAALTCGGIIVVYAFALLFGRLLGVTPEAVSSLHDLAILAFGAIVGSAVAVNGWKQPLAAVHERVDALEIATGIPTHPDGFTVTPPTAPPSAPADAS